MKRIALFVLLLTFGVAVAASNSFAQEGIVSIDTVKNSVYGDGTIEEGVNPRIVFRFNNTTGERINCSNGFKVTSPDGAQWDSITFDSVGPVSVDGENLIFLYWDQAFAFQPSTFTPQSGPPVDTFGLLGAGNPTKATKQLPIDYNDSVFAVVIWQTPGAVNNTKHFCIDSALGNDGLWTWVWVTRLLIDRHPTFVGLSGQTYEPNGTGVDRIGSGYCFEVRDPLVGVEEVEGSLPREFSVSQNYPNPFNPSTTIDYTVPRKSQVNLAVYNVLGQKVATLVDQEMAAGKYRAVWDGKADSGNPLSSGIYFYKFEADNFVKTNKMVMLK
jgi:hypothetical protein